MGAAVAEGFGECIEGEASSVESPGCAGGASCEQPAESGNEEDVEMMLCEAAAVVARSETQRDGIFYASRTNWRFFWFFKKRSANS